MVSIVTSYYFNIKVLYAFKLKKSKKKWPKSGPLALNVYPKVAQKWSDGAGEHKGVAGTSSSLNVF